MMSLKFLSVLPLLVTAVFCLFFSTMMAIMEMSISRIQDGPSETSGHAHLPYTVYAIEFLRFLFFLFIIYIYIYLKKKIPTAMTHLVSSCSADICPIRFSNYGKKKQINKCPSCLAGHTGSGVCEASRAPPTVGPTPNSSLTLTHTVRYCRWVQHS